MAWLSWHQDREKLSHEKHEIAYVKKIAKKLLEDLDGYSSRDETIIKAGKLRRICQYAVWK